MTRLFTMSIEIAAASALVGQVTGGYRVLSAIGSGTMGHVYDAEDVSRGTRVALKVLRRGHKKELAARFLREGKTLALLSHPNIVQLVDMGQLDDGTLFLATELVPGGSLRTEMDKGPIEPRRALMMVRQLLDALSAAHELGVVHRDIKPENVMLSEGDVIKVLDFGVAKLLADTVAGLGEANLTSVGFSIFGSALYIAPESVTGQPVDARIDIYSTGAMLFEMLTGRPVFDDQDPAVVLRNHAFDAPPTLQQASSAMSFEPEVEALVARALAKQPDDRYPSAADMIAAVEAAVQGLDQRAAQQLAAASARSTATAARESSAPPNVAVASDHRARTQVVRLTRRKKLVIAGGAMAVVLAAVVLSFAREGSGQAAASTTGALATQASKLVRAGSNQEAVELLERGLVGRATAEQAPAYLALGHAQFALGRRQQALAAYERALRAAPSVGSDKELRANLVEVLDGKRGLESVIALELLSSLARPDLDAVVSYASNGKLADARHRAIMIAERDGVGGKVDRVQSWMLDLQQVAGCDERRATIQLLARAADRRAVVALKRLRAVKCVEREVADAIAQIEAAGR